MDELKRAAPFVAFIGSIAWIGWWEEAILRVSAGFSQISDAPRPDGVASSYAVHDRIGELYVDASYALERNTCEYTPA
jgi:hypothetical protein